MCEMDERVGVERANIQVKRERSIETDRQGDRKTERQTQTRIHRNRETERLVKVQRS